MADRNHIDRAQRVIQLLQHQQQPQLFRFLSYAEFAALPDAEKPAYTKKAIGRLEKLDPARRRGA
jgi:hypothetical protein